MKPTAIVQKMMELDEFSRWLGIAVLETGEDHCMLKMTVRKEMLNGFGIAHGGISYSIADSALAFASNSGGRQSLSIETSIAHIKPLHEHDVIYARAKRITQTEKLGHYEVKVWKENDEQPVALFKGMVYRTSKNWTL